MTLFLEKIKQNFSHTKIHFHYVAGQDIFRYTTTKIMIRFLDNHIIGTKYQSALSMTHFH